MLSLEEFFGGGKKARATGDLPRSQRDNKAGEKNLAH